MNNSSNNMEGIAVIGLAGRFPGAKDVCQFWENLKNGVESLTVYSDEELIANGVSQDMLDNPSYVKSEFLLEDVDKFDATFFGFNPREAEIIDPQGRIFLETAWEALENAGYNPLRYSGLIGIYGGASMNDYIFNVYSRYKQIKVTAGFQEMISVDKDFLATRVAYKLNLRGPSLTVGTACSTSLVAIHLACQSLLTYECDISLAGGVSVNLPQKTGHLYQEGSILSLDGHCRAFDADAQGTAMGQGAGIVVLKRVAEAIEDGDTIHAVIKGSAINNDGASKVGYVAPSVDGQAEAIATCHALAQIDPETISYIETHGTGTQLGDPIEIAALTQAFRARTDKKGFCAIGSVKPNVGHLDAAAGVTGLIKTVMALKHKQIPPSLNFQKANPKIDFANSPFYVNTKLTEWESNGTPRRAGVSSAGVGGTNAHVVLEEAPVPAPSGISRPYQAILLSCKTGPSLENAMRNILSFIKSNPGLNIADAAYTLQVGREAFSHRCFLVCHDNEDAVSALEKMDRIHISTEEPEERPTGFLFTGQGAQYVKMGRDLYQYEEVFREHVDKCSELLQPHLGLDLRQVLYPGEEHEEVMRGQLSQTALTQPALFVIEYALARLWMNWGVTPTAMIGHSIGEYVAACLAGVFSLDDALALVAARGKLMQQLPSGTMLAVSMPSSDVELLLRKNDMEGVLSLAANNGPSLCVISGPTESCEKLESILAKDALECRKLHTSHAFHSPMMDSILEPFTEIVKRVELNAPEIPYLSNLTGTWIKDHEATDPGYWANHIRHTVRFSEGVENLLNKDKWNLLEVGPGQTLTTLVKQHQELMIGQQVLPSMRHPKDDQSDMKFILATIGRLWLSGQEIDWGRYYANERRQRIPLPTYPFERQRYWIERENNANFIKDAQATPGKINDMNKWFYVPIWKQSSPLKTLPLWTPQGTVKTWLVFMDDCGIGNDLIEQLQKNGQRIVTVKADTQYDRKGDREYTINPGKSADYRALIKELRSEEMVPDKILHLWSLTASKGALSPSDDFEKIQTFGFKSLVYLAQAIGDQISSQSVQMKVITNNLHRVTGEEQLQPEKATLLGPCRVMSQEYDNIDCTNIDIELREGNGPYKEKLIKLLMEELQTDATDTIAAYRGSCRWVQVFESVCLEQGADMKAMLSEGGVYVITGGLGGIGLVLAEHLARTVSSKLVLVGRTPLPDKEEWDHWLKTNDDNDAISTRIQKVRLIEQLGSEVLTVGADVTDALQVEEVLNKTHDRFGKINGVIHAAGVPGDEMILIRKDEADKVVQAPKTKGTILLGNLTRDLNLDFFVLCSSISSILGGIGQVDYCAANTFLDAFAQCYNSARRILTINWCTWQEVGMAVNTEVPNDLRLWRDEDLRHGISPEEGKEAFNRILNSGLSQVVVSTQDFSYLIEESKRTKASESDDTIPGDSAPKTSYPRPALSSVYVTPGNETERTIAGIWEDLIGIEKVGIHDNFFELGGHSLLATQVVARLRSTFPVEFPMTCLFERPTVHLLSKMVLEEEGDEVLLQESSSRGQKRKERKQKRLTRK